VGYSEFWERRRQGRGNELPLPVGPSPNGDIPTVQCQGIGGKEPDTASHRLHPGYGFPPAPPQIRFPAGSTPDTAAPLISPRTDPAPGRGRGRSAAGAGGVGEASRRAWVACRRRRGWGGAEKICGISGALETGEGERVPPPREPPPPVAISTRSSARGDPGEKPGTVSHRLHPGYGCSPDIATHGPRPREGAGEERRRRGWGGGGRGNAWVSPAEGAGGVGRRRYVGSRER